MSFEGVQLKALRAKTKITQQELSERSGIDREKIAKIETGARRMSATDAAYLAHGLGIGDIGIERRQLDARRSSAASLCPKRRTSHRMPDPPVVADTRSRGPRPCARGACEYAATREQRAAPSGGTQSSRGWGRPSRRHRGVEARSCSSKARPASARPASRRSLSKPRSGSACAPPGAPHAHRTIDRQIISMLSFPR
jgi:transcriptional regulator with XRE-family HTH domain